MLASDNQKKEMKPVGEDFYTAEGINALSSKDLLFSQKRFFAIVLIVSIRQELKKMR
jgi:hypothetical protein